MVVISGARLQSFDRVRVIGFTIRAKRVDLRKGYDFDARLTSGVTFSGNCHVDDSAPENGCEQRLDQWRVSFA